MKKSKKEDWDYSKEPETYDEWLTATGEKDTKLNREWYSTPDEERAAFIKKHKSWWDE